MPQRPTYNRSPRLIPALPREEIEIPGPPTKPTPPRPLWMTIMTSGMMAVMILFLGFFTGRSMIFFLPFMLASVLSGFVINRFQKRDYERAVQERESGYQTMLMNYAQDFKTKQNEQYKLLHHKDPPPDECFEWVNALNPNLWARTPADDDFLEIRLGIGNRPSTVTFKLPDHDHPFAPDPLILQAHTMAGNFKVVPEAPISLFLADAGVAGVAGENRADVLYMMRTLVVQLATHHSPDEVKFVAVYPKAEEEEWDWIRWLPHAWDNERKQRFVADSPETVYRLFSNLNDMLSRRQSRQADKAGDEKQVALHPFYLVFILAAPELVKNEPLINRLQTEGPGLGAYSIFLHNRIRDLPQKCRAIIKVAADETYLMQVTPNLVHTNLSVEKTKLNAVRRFTQAIAPLQLEQVSSATLPPSVTLLQLYGVLRVENLKIHDRWAGNRTRITDPDKKSKIEKFNLTVPIGLRTGHRKLNIDLHELAHGPNGLVAGMVGSGKSELLQTLVASLAIHFDPRQLAFVLIDYKGGGMAVPFKNLPHTLGTIDNLQEENLTARALTSFQRDIEKRERLFKRATEKTGQLIHHIDDYQEYYYSGMLDHTEFEPMPYLVIIVDEFAEMKTEHPEEAKDFVRIARVGRALGYRMILAMQKPEGIVDGQIEANTRFRLCLRVAQVADSQAMLKRPDAAYLSHIGRTYFQVGANEIYEEFQTAWSGEKYDPDGHFQGDEQAIVEIYLDGTKTPLYSPKKERQKHGDDQPDSLKQPTQLQSLVSHIQKIVSDNQIEPVDPLWLEPLKKSISLHQENLLGQVWTPDIWQETGTRRDWWLNPVAGLLDDPHNKRQLPLQFNLEDNGNLSIHAAPGGGKTTFLQTLITSLVWRHSPEDLHLYILDFGSRILDMYASLPHVGAVIGADETGRLKRLLDFIQDKITTRKRQFSRIGGAKGLFDYRQKAIASGQKKLPAIVLILDDYDNFFEAFYKNHQEVVEQFNKIVIEGRAVGIYVVITSSKTLSSKLTTYINQVAALPLLDKGHYTDIIGSKALMPEKTPGRGVLKGSPPLEFQTATGNLSTFQFIEDVSPESVVRHMQETAQIMQIAPQLHAVPDTLDADNFTKIIQSADGHYLPTQIKAAIGLEIKGLLSPFSVGPRMGTAILIAGPSGSGKTNLLRAWLLAMTASYSPDDLNLYIFDSQRQGLSAFRGLPHVRGYATIPEDVGPILGALEDVVINRCQPPPNPETNGEKSDEDSPLVMIVTDDLFNSYDDILSDENKYKERLDQIMQRGRNLKFQLLAAGTSNEMAPKYNNHSLLKFLKSGSTFLLGNEQGETYFGLPYSLQKISMEAGEGFWVERNEWRKVKIIDTPENSESFKASLVQIKSQFGQSATDDESVLTQSGEI